MKHLICVWLIAFMAVPIFAIDKAPVSTTTPPVYTRIDVRPVDPNFQPNSLIHNEFVPEESAPAWIEEAGGHWKLVTVLPNMAIAIPKTGVDLTSRQGNTLVACGNAIAYVRVPKGKFIELSRTVQAAPVVESVPMDVCPNIQGAQTSVPSGMTIDRYGNCVTLQVEADMCFNIQGIQTSVPSGMMLDDHQNCVPRVVDKGGWFCGRHPWGCGVAAAVVIAAAASSGGGGGDHCSTCVKGAVNRPNCAPGNTCAP